MEHVDLEFAGPDGLCAGSRGKVPEGGSHREDDNWQVTLSLPQALNLTMTHAVHCSRQTLL